MPTLDEMRNAGRIVSLVIAERLGLDTSEITNIYGSVDLGVERVHWQGVRDMPPGFINECMDEARRRIEAGKPLPFTPEGAIVCPKCGSELAVDKPGVRYTLIHEADGSHTFDPASIGAG